MISLQEIWKLLSGDARQQAEQANEAAYQNLERTMCAKGIDGLDDIDRMMRRGGNGHDKPVP
jgi:hypothetical protein